MCLHSRRTPPMPQSAALAVPLGCQKAQQVSDACFQVEDGISWQPVNCTWLQWWVDYNRIIILFIRLKWKSISLKFKIYFRLHNT